MQSRIYFLLLGAALAGCLGNDYETRTIVHENGTLERRVSIEGADSSMLEHNLFGASEAAGWRVEIVGPDSLLDNTMSVSFSRNFETDSAANVVMYDQPDTLLKIRSQFVRQSGWFYNTIRYTDVYRASVRFNKVKADDFFSIDDYEFLRQYARPGKKTPADSARHAALDERVEEYLSRGILEESFDHIMGLAAEDGLEKRWIDTLNVHKDDLLRYMMTSDSELRSQRSFLLDTLKIPFKREPAERFEVNIDRLVITLFDTFRHVIEMPSSISETNADSVSANVAFWKIGDDLKLRDYEMTAETRSINYLNAMITVVVIILALYYLLRGRRGS